MKRALLFPGQGSQRVGMGRELCREFPAAQEVFDEADEVLGYRISEVCFEGPEESLKLTENTQPAILTNSIAVLRAIQSQGDFSFELCAGHSLGEWSALVAAGVLSLADAVRLVHLRGKAMQAAVPAGQGAMAAIMGMTAEAVLSVCGEAAQGQVLSPANFNGAGQIVISGDAGAVERATVLAKERGAKRAMMLQVSAPFHCGLMQPAADAVADALAGINFGTYSVPVVANVDAIAHRESSETADLLVRQVTGTVMWEQCMAEVRAAGIGDAVELGSGSVLRGLARRIDRAMQVTTVGEPHEVRAVFEGNDND